MIFPLAGGSVDWGPLRAGGPCWARAASAADARTRVRAIRRIPRRQPLVFIAILVLVTRYLLKLVRLFFAGLAGGTITLANFDPEWAWPTYRIVRFVAVAFTVVVAYPYIPGSTSPAFQGVSIFIGVIFSLGSSSFIANLIAGYSMTYRRAFRVGDRIQIGDYQLALKLEVVQRVMRRIQGAQRRELAYIDVTAPTRPAYGMRSTLTSSLG